MGKILAVLVVGCLLCCGQSEVQAEAEWEEIGEGNVDIRSVLLEPENQQVIYMGTKSAVYKSEDAGKSWRSVLSVKGENKAVNFLLKDKNALYAATGNGLYRSNNQGRVWSRIFKGKNSRENDCTALAVLPYGIYLGTKAGLFVSKDNGRFWRKEAGKIGDSRILAIACNLREANHIYIACVDGVFKTQDAGNSWDRVFVANPTENGNDWQEETDDYDEQQQYSDIRYISLDPNNLDCLYLGTGKGVYQSRDKGKTWQLLSSFGLLSQDVKFLMISNRSEIFAATKSGVFKCEGERWQELSLRLVAEDIGFVTEDNQGNLYVACDKGLFKAGLENFCAVKQGNPIEIYLKDEPEINEVQEAAIKYAEVEPEKIARWRKQAAKRAWLPKLSIGMDYDKDRTISKSVWGIYSSYSSGSISAPGRYYIGPDDETNYNNRNWSVSLSWELGDLIWNDDQTSIDVRSRLMVQLRDDILDEVTKLYFERLRLKMELDNISIEDRKKRMEKELRLRELTASLDALTGGYFSKQSEKNKVES